MSIKYPDRSQISRNHRAILVSIGGSSASSSTDKISTFGLDFCRQWNADNPRALALPIVGSATVFDSTNRMSERILDFRRRVWDESLRWPSVIMVGKSMGGCKLHRVAKRLSAKSVEVDLFVGVDMSCFVGRHYDTYMEFGRDAKLFPRNVKSLVNFYQTLPREMQTGHYALMEPSEGVVLDRCTDFNVDVNSSTVRVDLNGILVPGAATPLCRGVGHADIDSDPALIESVRRLVVGRVLARYLQPDFGGR